MTFRLYFLLIFIVISACTPAKKQALSKPNPAEEKAAFIECSEQRANMCTRQYLPVCATRDTGVRCVTTPCPSSEQKTYSNGCEACTDAKVLGYVANACAQEPAKK
jgi:hypothetical protein